MQRYVGAAFDSDEEGKKLCFSVGILKALPPSHKIRICGGSMTSPSADEW